MKRNHAIAAALAAGLILSASVDAAAQAKQRPIQDFVDAQGTFCFDLFTPGHCLLFVPPIENFIGWGDPTNTLLASVDYAGLADEWLQAQPGGQSLGTSFSGSVTERPLADGRAEVHVVLKTQNALVWAVNNNGTDEFNSPLTFGVRAPDVLNHGATPVLGSSHLEVKYIASKPGAPLPDLIQLWAVPEAGQEMTYIKFVANVTGTMTDGSAARLQVTQTGLLNIPGQGAVSDGFPAEHIKLHPVGN